MTSLLPLTEIEQRAAVVAEAESWIGTPFAHRHAKKGIGVDCGYLALAIHAAVGTCPMVALPYYSTQWLLHSDDELYVRELLKRCHEVLTPLPGDIAVFQMARVYGHGAVVVEWPMVVHANFKGKVEWADATKFPLERRKTRFFSPWPLAR